MSTPNLPSFKYPSSTCAPKSAEELATLNLDAAARALTDDAFENDPAVIRSGADVEAWSNRLKRLVTYPGKSNVIQTLVDGVAAELDAAREAYRFACLDDFLAGDNAFNGAIAAASRVLSLEQRLQAAKTAKLDLDRSPTQLSELHELADRATAVLQNTRFELKKKAVLAQRVDAEVA